MPRGISIKKILLDSSISAFWAGVEIHNKPHIAYRYQTTVVLILNAWELLLEAYVYTKVGKKEIYKKRYKHYDNSTISQEKRNYTKTFSQILNIVEQDIDTKNKEFKAVYKNLQLLDLYRNEYIHFAEKTVDSAVFILLSKAVQNYNFYINQWFNIEITKNEDLIILPIGMKLPFNPIQFLKQSCRKTCNSFIYEIIRADHELHEDGIQDGVIIDFGINLNKTSLKRADLTSIIDKNDPNAIPIKLTDEEILQRFPLTYTDLRKKVKEKDPNIKINKLFNKAKKAVEDNGDLCYTRYLNIETKKSHQTYYALKAVDVLIKKYVTFLQDTGNTLRDE